MKQRSPAPGASFAPVTQLPGSVPLGRTLIFWPPNFSAVRLSRAEFLALHAEHALIPGGGDLHVLHVQHDVVDAVDGESHHSSPS